MFIMKIGLTDRFAILIVSLFYVFTVSIGYFFTYKNGEIAIIENRISKKLVHLVLIKFKTKMTVTDLQLVKDEAYSLQQIKGVESLRFGTNVSPEGLNQDFTYSLTMKFKTARHRDSIYLPHHIHQKFVKLFVPYTESVLVYDFWE